MKKKTIITISIITIIITSLLIAFTPKKVYADFDVNGIAGSINTNDVISTKGKFENVFETIINNLLIVGSIVSVIALILIGIKYMVSSVEEKAEYKERAIPYLIGAILVFAIPKILDLAINMGETLAGTSSIEDIGSKIIAILSTVGSIVSVVVLIVIGIKYMGQSIEEKAHYKQSIMPYVIGAVLVFAASTLASAIYNFIQGMF